MIAELGEKPGLALKKRVELVKNRLLEHLDLQHNPYQQIWFGRGERERGRGRGRGKEGGRKSQWGLGFLLALGSPLTLVIIF